MEIMYNETNEIFVCVCVCVDRRREGERKV